MLFKLLLARTNGILTKLWCRMLSLTYTYKNNNINNVHRIRENASWINLTKREFSLSLSLSLSLFLFSTDRKKEG